MLKKIHYWKHISLLFWERYNQAIPLCGPFFNTLPKNHCEFSHHKLFCYWLILLDYLSFFSRVFCHRTRANVLKLKDDQFGLEVRKKFFTPFTRTGWPERQWLTHPWSHPRLDGAQNSLPSLEMSLLSAGEWPKGIVKVSINHSVILWTHS